MILKRTKRKKMDNNLSSEPNDSTTQQQQQQPSTNQINTLNIKAHKLTGPIYVAPSRIEGSYNFIDGDVVLGSQNDKPYTLKIQSDKTKIQSKEIDFSLCPIKNFASTKDGDILLIKGGVVSKLSTDDHIGDFLRVGVDGLPTYESIESLLESRERSLSFVEKSNNQKVFPQSMSVIMGWNADSQSLFNDGQFDLATGRFIPTSARRFRIEASITFLNEGNIGWRTLMIRKNSTISLSETIAQSQADTSIPQTLKVSHSFYATVGDFFEIVLSHTDPDPITILSGPPTTLGIERV